MADGYISQIKTPDNKVYLLKDSEKGYKWNAVTQGQKWSRICLITPTVTVEGSSGILSISCTRGNVVCNATFLIAASHASKCFINALGTTKYTAVRIRGVVQSNGTVYIELYDTAQAIAAGTAQAWHCSYIPILSSTVTTYTAFTDGTTLPSGYTAVNDFTAPQGDNSAPVVSISRSGTTFTATRSNGSTFTFTQQDNNTTYTFENGTNGFKVTPSGGTAQTVTVTPSITNNITGSGTTNYLTKFTGTNTIGNSGLTTDTNNNLTIPGSIYFGNNASSGKAILSFSSTYPKYGIWYKDANNDIMSFSSSNNADKGTSADFAIEGGGKLYNKGSIIPNTGNATGSIGGTTTPVYVDAGVIKAGTALGTASQKAESYFVKAITSTDNTIARFDGTSGQIQNSKVILDDNGNIKPDATDTYSLGAADKRWNAYFAPKTIGGRNYIYSTPIAGGRSTIEEKTVVFNPNANNGDSYFYVKAARDIPVGTYTFSMDCEGLGANEVWTFGIISQNSGKVISVKNGRSALTFEVATAITAGTKIILDDIGRPTTSTRVVFSNFMWEAATSPSDFSYAPEEIEDTYAKKITSTKYGIAYYSDTDGTFAGTGAGTSGQYLKSNGNSAPTWATFSASTVGLGNVENTKLSTWTGSSNITTVGTISTGTWHGTKIANDYIANPKVTIAGNDVSLGGSLTAATLTSSLGLSNALHFIGITSTILADGSTTTTLTPKSTGSLSKTTGFVNGDVVMDGDQLREYVWSGSAWRLLGITTSTAYTQPTSTATNTWIAQISQGTDGKITATTGSLDTSGTWSGNAATATALTSDAGGVEQPIYFSSGKPVATSYSLAASVASGIKGFLVKYTSAHGIGNSDICDVSNVSFSTVTPSYTGGGDKYYKAWLSYICDNYSTAATYIGTANPNSKGPIFGNIYNVTEKDSTTNLPRYSTFLFNNLGGALEAFGTNNYNYYHYTYLNNSNYTNYTVTKTGTGASGSWGISITGNAANVTGTVAIEHGGTGQTTLTAARQQFSGPEFIVGTWTAASNTWTGVTTDSELYDGKQIILYMPFAGTSSSATLNLTLADGTTTGAKNVYFESTTRFTTHKGQNAQLHLIYHSGLKLSNGTTYEGWWYVANRDTDNDYRTRQNVLADTDSSNRSLLLSNPAVGTANNNTSYVTYRNDKIYANVSTGIITATGFDGDLTGNADTATAANLTSTANAVAYYTNTTGTFGSKASANGALYATSANGALQWGTLPIAQGGTGVTSFTKNHVILSDNTNGTTGLTSRAYSDSTSAGALSNSSTNFVTERDVYFGLPTLNNAHNYTSSSTYYAPTAGGTAGHVLIGAGATTAPAWYGGTVMSGTAAASWKTAFNGTTDATATNAAAVTIAGGLGVAKKLHVGSTLTVPNITIGSTNEYGDAYTPIYWHEGVPTAVTLTQQCAFTIKSGKSGVRLSHAAITANSYVTEIVITSGESKLNSAISWTSAAGYIELTCSSTVSGDVTGYIMISRGGEITATATDIT